MKIPADAMTSCKILPGILRNAASPDPKNNASNIKYQTTITSPPKPSDNQFFVIDMP